MASPESDEKPTPSPLDAEREKLRNAGYNETEISQILVARALGSPGHSSDAPTGQGVLSGTLSSVMAIGNYARGTVFTIRNDLATIFDRTAVAYVRVGAAAMLVFKMAVIAVLAYAGWQEWRQHIISATAIADSQARKIRAEECSARAESFWRNMPLSDLQSGNYDDEQLARDCDPTYAAREAQCDARSKAIVSDLDHLKPGDNEGVNRVMKQVSGFKNDCRVTEERQRLVKEAAGRAVALFERSSEHPNTTDGSARAEMKVCDEKFKIVLAAIETIDFKDKDPNTTLKTKIEQYKGECTVTEAQQAAAKAAFDKRAEKLAKLSAVVARLAESEKAEKAWKSGDYATAYSLAQQYAATIEADEVKETGKAGKVTAGALIRLSWYALFGRKFQEALDAAERSITLNPPGLVPQGNRAHALMFLGRAAEAKAAYLANKGKPLQGKTWELVVADDFAMLRKAGITHPLMVEVENELSSSEQRSVTASPPVMPPAAPTPSALEAARRPPTHLTQAEPLPEPLASGSPAPDPDIEAVRLYKLEADRGDADAQLNLGKMYEAGRGGLMPDPREAARLYRLSADQGNAGAQLQLAYMYENGDVLSKDWREAARLYRLAADQGNADAQANLADFYERGDAGLRRNACEATHLRKLAAAQGNTYAAKALKGVSATRCKL